jgi:hypothetical protein
MLIFYFKHNYFIKYFIFHQVLKKNLYLKNNMSKYNIKYNSFINNIITKIHIQWNRPKSFLIVEGHFDLVSFSCFYIRFDKISNNYPLSNTKDNLFVKNILFF